MKNVRYIIVSLWALLTLSATTFAQPITTASDLHEGVYFEIAYGVVWASPTERPLPQPLMLLISSRYKTRCTVFSASELGAINKVYSIEANKVLRVEIKTPYLSLTTGGIRVNGVTITSEAPITVSTYIAYQGNGNMTLHYPVATWGKSYHVFSNPQDEYGALPNLYRRPGQIVILAAADNTFVTINSPVRIAASLDHDVIAANTPVTVELEAHETLTLLAEVDSAKSHTVSSNLTGTRITSTKPIAVMSGHTKGAVGIKYPILPPTGTFSAPAHFIRNNYYQSLLHDSMADTAFVTVPMMYTATRAVSAETAGDVVRILALQTGTVIWRSRLDGSSDVKVATLDSGRTYTDTAVADAYKWKSSKPVLVMQYGKSYALILPPGGETQTPIVKDITTPQGHPTVVSGMPTMMVVPGTSQWIERGTYYAPEGMDNFVSVVMKTQDIGSILVDGARLNGSWINAIPGTDFSYIRMAVPTGDRQVTTEPAAKFMAWSHGSLDGLQQGRAYGHPIGVNMTRACVDSIAGYADRLEPYARANARIISGAECSSMLRYEVLSSTNASVDSVSYHPNIFDPDSLSVYVLKTNIYEVGLMTVRFTSTGGKTVEVDLTLPATPLPPRPQHYVFYEIAAAKRYDTIVASVILDSAIDPRFTKCHVHLRYNTRSIRLVTPFTFDSSSGTEHTSRFLMPITSHTAGTILGKVLFVYQTPDPFASIYPTLQRITWFEGTVEQTNVDLHLRTVIIDTIPDTTQVHVDEEAPATAGYSGPTLALSPQPAHDIVSITYRKVGYSKGQQGGALRAGSNTYMLRVYDYTGTLVMDLSDKLVGEEGTIFVNTHGLARGMYVLQMSNGEQTTAVRLIVE